jgi:hypothetical protein
MQSVPLKMHLEPNNPENIYFSWYFWLAVISLKLMHGGLQA